MTPAVVEPDGVLELPQGITRDFDAIRRDGTLKVALPTDSTSYFLYRNQPMGFEYEVLDAFAKAQSLTLDVVVIQGREERLAALADGQVDVAGGRLSHDLTLQDSVTFSAVLFESSPLTVQAEPGVEPFVDDVDDYRELPNEAVSLAVSPIDEVSDIAGREIWLQRDSQWVPTVVELEDEFGDVTVVGVDPDVSTETLIRWVAAGKAPFTVASEDIAELKGSYYQNLVTAPILGPPTPFGLATATPSTELAQTLSEWTEDHEAEIERLHRKYFVDRQGYRERIDANPLSGPVEQVSDYDDLFKSFASEIGWDWRLLAAQAFQESAFDPDAESWAGAQGLLQLMPPTAREVGVTDPWNPTDNVRGATKYLVGLDQRLQPVIEDGPERIKFVLASYNAGLGHVEDAQRLAAEAGDDPTDWDAVAYWLLQLSRREVYSHPVVEYGFCRGAEPVMYVERILTRFGHYEKLVQQ